MKQNSIFFKLLLLIIFLSGVGIAFILNPFLFPKQSLKTEEKKQEAKKHAYIYESKPPSQALQGILSNLSGEIEKKERDKEDWEKISSPSAIIQGEGLKTGKTGKADIAFSDQLNLALGNNAQVWFVNLLPDQILLEQEDGLVNYENTKPFSLRIFNSLIYFEEGSYKMEVDRDLGRFNLNIFSGNAKLFFVDKDNETQVYKLAKGNNVKYNSATKTVIIK